MNQEIVTNENDNMEGILLAQNDQARKQEVDSWFGDLIGDSPDNTSKLHNEEQAWGSPISQPDRYMSMMQGTEGANPLTKKGAEESKVTFKDALHNLSEVPYSVASGAVDGVNEVMDLAYHLAGKLLS